MNIIDIYNKYHLPENLQMHMLRVAACSNLIIDNWNGPKIDKESIIRVSLLFVRSNYLLSNYYMQQLLTCAFVGSLVNDIYYKYL